MVDLTELAKRVEAATAPDGEIEAEIWLAVTEGATRNKWSYVHKATGRECDVDETRDKFGHLVLVPRYMESLDAAIALVPVGWSCCVCSDERPGFANVHKLVKGEGPSNIAIAATPALALTAAALRARAQEAAHD